MQFFSKHTDENRRGVKLMAYIAVVLIVIILLFIIFSETANAGLISSISSLLSSESAMAKSPVVVNEQNLQTISLLQAPTNINPNMTIIADIIPVENDETLVADLASVNTGDDTVYNTKISTYVVRSGDTISGVAKMFNVSVNTILWANNLNSRATLSVGQTLTILPITGITYKVKSGDTIKGIANKYSADVTDILVYNDLSLSTKLVVGQTILIPDAELLPNEIAQSKALASNRVISGFIRPVVGGFKTQGFHGNNAIDIAAPLGTPIVASAGGTVIISRTGTWSGGYGNYVVISHPNGTQTVYAHNLKNYVSAGERVSQGEVIAAMGSTGNSTGPHVHFEIRGAQNPF